MPLDNTILEKAASKLLADYKQANVYKMGTNQDYEGDVQLGNPLKIFTAPDVSTATYTRGSTTVAYEDITPAEQVFVVNQYKHWGIKADDLEKRFARADVWERTIRNGAYQLAKDADTFISTAMLAALISANTLTARTVGLGLNANAFETLVDLEKALENQDVPMDDLHVFIPPDYEGFLVKDGRYSQFNTAEALKNLRGQEIGRVRFATVHKTTAVPTTGDYSRIIMCSKEAMTYAEILEDLQELPMDKDDYDVRLRSRLVFGGKVVQPRAIAAVNVKFAS